MKKADVVVIGAGAVGLTLAYELAGRGRRVALIERDRLIERETDGCSIETPFRTASSWAAAGILPPANLEVATDPIERLRGLSHQLYPNLATELEKETGIDCNLHRCGGWYLSDSVGETASMVGMVAFWRDLSIECDEVPLSDLADREPAMKSWTQKHTDGRAWFVPDEYQICTPLFLQALVAACRRRGVEIIDQSRVTDLREVDGGAAVEFKEAPARVRAASPQTLSSEGTGEQVATIMQADQVVLCGGVWSGLVSSRLRLSQSLVPVRGQILLLKTERAILSGIVNIGQRYLVPRLDGAVLVGSCEEEVGFQHGTTPGALADLRRFAYDVCPQLESARELGAWSGLRPLTFDGFPMIGKLPDSKALFVAAGHFRSGIHLAPATARCLADVMLGIQPPVDIEPFRVGKQQSH